MTWSHKQPLILLLGLCLLLSGCGAKEPTPTLAQLYATAPTRTVERVTLPTSPSPIARASRPLQPSSTDAPATTMARKGTRLPGRATPGITPRSTVTPTNATETAVAATANPISGPVSTRHYVDFPPDVNPLTGLQVSDPALLERCPLAIKVSNAPTIVRPQAGLDKADLIFEHYAEGGVTRLTAVFLGQTPTMVGSIRSGRLIDLEIPAMFKALFAYSGSSAGVGREYTASDLWPDQIASPWSASAAFYRRDLNKAYEHTLFVNPTALWTEAKRRGINGRKDLRGMTFDPTLPAGGSPAEELSILYQSGISQVRWVYNASASRYYRWQGGAAHCEEVSVAQLSAANVIVVGANHVETLILEDTWGGGHRSIEVQIWGEGPVSIFRDGHRYDGTWRRQARSDLFSFWTQDGSQRLPLKPGNSWLQMVPLGFTGLVVSDQ